MSNKNKYTEDLHDLWVSEIENPLDFMKLTLDFGLRMLFCEYMEYSIGVDAEEKVWKGYFYYKNVKYPCKKWRDSSFDAIEDAIKLIYAMINKQISDKIIKDK